MIIIDLLEDFNIEQDDSFHFKNLKLINKYCEYNNVKLFNNEMIFGENPLNKFNEWLTWLNQEQEKDFTEQSKQLCDDILKTLNSISGFMSSLPILLCPIQQKSSSFDFLRKQSKKKKDCRIDYKNNNQEEQKLFCCELCFETFKSGQGLGGHMSRKHKDQSIKFKRKKEIRMKREPIRNILLKAKEQLCKANCIDFEETMKTKQGKKNIKHLILQHYEEYKKIRNDLKRSYFSNR